MADDSSSLSQFESLLFVERLLASGVSLEVIRECLKEDDVLQDRARGFMNPPPVPTEDTRLWRPVPGKRYAIEVNLAYEPQRPAHCSEVAWRWGRQKGWVTVEWKGNEHGYNLWVDGVKQKRHQPPEGPLSPMRGHDLKSWFESYVSTQLHPNVMDAAIKAGILSVAFGRDCSDEPVRLYAWAVGFGGPGGEFVRCYYVRDGAWRQDCRSLSELWHWKDRSLFPDSKTSTP